MVAIGTETGRWLVLDCETHEIVTSHTDGNEQIECALYSPGKYMKPLPCISILVYPAYWVVFTPYDLIFEGI